MVSAVDMLGLPSHKACHTNRIGISHRACTVTVQQTCGMLIFSFAVHKLHACKQLISHQARMQAWVVVAGSGAPWSLQHTHSAGGVRHVLLQNTLSTMTALLPQALFGKAMQHGTEFLQFVCEMGRQQSEKCMLSLSLNMWELSTS